MNGCTICEELDLTTPEVEATEQDLRNYHPEEDEATLDEWYSLPR